MDYTRMKERNSVNVRNTDCNPESIWDAEKTLLAAGVFRVICVIVWTGCIIYASYSIYLAGDEFPPLNKLQTFSGGVFGFMRERDWFDEEWNRYLATLVSKLGYWFLAYVIISHLLQHLPIRVQMAMSVLMTCSFSITLMGWKSVVFFIQQPLLYCILMNTMRSKLVIWAVTIASLWLINFEWIRSIYIAGSTGSEQDWLLSEFCFHLIISWNFARCVSFCFDNWDRPNISLLNCISYCFYFPTALTGPIVLYSTFERDILLQRGKRGNLKNVVWRLVYIGLILCLCELILHTLHFHRMATKEILWKVNLWTAGGIIFWKGQFFMLKYMVMYGFPTVIGENDGLEMPPLPKCVAYIHRYSVMWKDFDRGLYNFLIKYTYVPTIQYLNTSKVTNPIHPEVKKLIASFLTFYYVYIWHGIYDNVKVWAFFNFVGITVERFGSYVKKRIQSHKKFHSMIWDFVMEPIFTLPLAAMSILNTAVFICSTDVAIIFTKRFCSTWKQNYLIYILFCFTHVAVTIRTLPSFSAKLKKCWKKQS